VVLFVGIVTAGVPSNCPRVFDGLTRGHFDLETQFLGNSLSANWVGLSSIDVARYECAVISEEQFHEKMLSESCRLASGFSGIPQIHSWTNVQKDTSITFKNLNLVPDKIYYIVLRTTLSNGAQVYSNSNGVRFIVEESTNEVVAEKLNNSKGDEIPVETVVGRAKKSGSRATRDSPLECPLDEANRCRIISVQQFLNEIYGKPVPFRPQYNDDDDDDWNSAGAIVGGVFGGVLLLCCLLLCLLALLALLATAFRDSESPFSEDIISVTSEPVDADLGSSTQHHLVGADTRVEFPDLDPSSRLN